MQYTMNFREAKRYLKTMLSEEDYDFYVDFYERMDEARNHKTFKPKTFDKFLWIMGYRNKNVPHKNGLRFEVAHGSDHYKIKYDTTRQPVFYYPATNVVIYRGSVEKLHHWLFLFIYIIKLDKMNKATIYRQNKAYERVIKKELIERHKRKDKPIMKLIALLDQYGGPKIRSRG